jgi:hypothetical protein
MATVGSSSTDTVRDALGLLERDQRLLAALFEEFDIAAAQQLDPLARRIAKMLRVHLQIKEEILYPTARRALSDTAPVERSEHQARAIREAITRVESLSSDDSAFSPAVRLLAGEVATHSRDEGSALFASLRGATIDLVAIGITLAERRDTLMDVLGLHADDEERVVYPAENPAIAIAIAERHRDRQS